MSVIVKNYKEVKTGPMGEVMNAIGKLGIIRDKNYPSYNGAIILRVYEAVISLTNPTDTWSEFHSNTINVEALPAGTIVEYGSEI